MDDVKKTTKLLKKLERQKHRRLTHFFNKKSYIQNKFVIEKRVNRRRFFIDDKKMQKFDLSGDVASF